MTRNFIFSVLVIVLFSACSSTIILSNPDKARVYVNGKYKGETPYKYTDAKGIFSKTKIRLAKDGYSPIDTVIARKEKVAVGAIVVEGLLLLSETYIPIPLLWCLGYAPKHQYELTPNPEFKLTDTVITAKPKPVYYDYSKPSLRFAVNPTEFLVNDYSLFVDYVTKNKKSFGISGGVIIANRWWNQDHEGGQGFEIDDDNLPVGVYNGFAGRAYYKSYFIKQEKSSSIKNKIWYLCPVFVFKDLHYDNIVFGDKISPYEWVTYERSEKAKVFGLELLYGKENYLTKHIFIDFYWGMGARIKLREYTTFWVSAPVMPVGQFTRNQIFPTVHLGVKVGFGFPLGKN